MNNQNNTFSWAAKWMLMCSALQISLPLVLGFNAAAYLMVALGILGWVTAFGLFQGWRWLAYAAYIPVMGVMILAFAKSFDVVGLAGFWYLGIALFDGFTMVALFKALWRKPQLV